MYVHMQAALAACWTHQGGVLLRQAAWCTLRNLEFRASVKTLLICSTDRECMSSAGMLSTHRWYRMAFTASMRLWCATATLFAYKAGSSDRKHSLIRGTQSCIGISAVPAARDCSMRGKLVHSSFTTSTPFHTSQPSKQAMPSCAASAMMQRMCML